MLEKNNFTSSGIKNHAITETTTIVIVNTVNTEFINFCASCFLSSITPLRNGMSTEIDTSDAIEAKIKSGIRNDV
jgi:hypothetical protein